MSCSRFDHTGRLLIGLFVCLLGCGSSHENHRGRAELLREENLSECEVNLIGIKTAMLAYDAEFDRYVSQREWWPDDTPSATPRAFTRGSAFDTLGWMPNSQVRGSYRVVSTVIDDASVPFSSDFRGTCIMDADGDGIRASYTTTRRLGVTQNTPSDVR